VTLITKLIQQFLLILFIAKLLETFYSVVRANPTIADITIEDPADELSFFFSFNFSLDVIIVESVMSLIAMSCFRGGSLTHYVMKLTNLRKLETS
jgi:hypothetical protein